MYGFVYACLQAFAACPSELAEPSPKAEKGVSAAGGIRSRVKSLHLYYLYSTLFRLKRKCSQSDHCLEDYGGEFSGQTFAELIGSNDGGELGQG